jgi:hypothetical protein
MPGENNGKHNGHTKQEIRQEIRDNEAEQNLDVFLFQDASATAAGVVIQNDKGGPLETGPGDLIITVEGDVTAKGGENDATLVPVQIANSALAVNASFDDVFGG